MDTSGFFITIFKKLYDFKRIDKWETLSYEEAQALMKEERKEEKSQEESKSEPRNKEYLAGIEFKPKDQD